MKWRVAVEKLPPRKVLRKTLRQQALQATFAPRVEFSILKILAVLRKTDFFNSHVTFHQLTGPSDQTSPLTLNEVSL